MSRAALLFLIAVLVAPVAADMAPPPQSLEVTRAIDAAYHAAYNLDYPQAEAAARRAVAVGQSESRAHRALAAILWLDTLFQRGAASVDHYLGGVTKSEAEISKPPAPHDAEFKREIARAIELAEARLTANARDVEARYDLGAAHGLQASYTASIDGSMVSAFRAGKRAFDAQEDVLKRDAKRVDAALIVGSYRYAVSVLSLPSRVFAYVAGFGGGKQLGIELVERALADSDTRVQAKAALVLIFTREGRHLDAMRLLAELERDYPRNRLFVLEQGAAAIRAGRMADAERILLRGIAALEGDARPKMPGEQAYWLYKLGVARIGLNRRADAKATLSTALTLGPVDWVRGRIHLGLGQILDLNRQRAEALEEYRTAKRISQTANDSWSTVRADRLLKQPFTLAPTR